MPRFKRYTERDVLTEAIVRIRRIFDLFDAVAVCFSGGKDSLTCLQLVRQVAVEELGHDRVNVVFRDEELIPDAVIDFVENYRREPWVKMAWLCMPLKGDKFVLGRRRTYVQWDKNRPWVREKPPWAIQLEGEYRVLDQYTADRVCAEALGLKGAICFITGIRADESLIRYRSVVNKLHDNFICTPMGGNPRDPIKVGKPIYDWSENDVFKFLGERGIGWCRHYDAQHLAGVGLRVSTPLHAEAAKRIGKLRVIDPGFYDRVLAVFPDMAVQDRYWAECDLEGLWARYAGEGWDGCKRFIREQITEPEQAAMARRRLAEFRGLARRDPEAYPPAMLLECLISGSIKRVLTPAGPADRARLRKKMQRLAR